MARSRNPILLCILLLMTLALAACGHNAEPKTSAPDATSTANEAATTVSAPAAAPAEPEPADERLGDYTYTVPDGWTRVMRDGNLHELFASGELENRDEGYIQLLFLPYPDRPPFETLDERKQYDELRSLAKDLAQKTGMVYERAENTYALNEAAIRFAVTVAPDLRPDVTSRGLFGYTPHGYLMMTVCYPPAPEMADEILDDLLQSFVFDDVGDGKVPDDYRAAIDTAQILNDQLYLSQRKLYDQLRSEDGGGHTAAAASYAVGHIKADWKENAKTVAEIFAHELNLSREGIERHLLSPTGGAFTKAEAAYALEGLEADWADNARAKAKEYKADGMTPEDIYTQLFSIDLFTEDEARKAVDSLD